MEEESIQSAGLKLVIENCSKEAGAALHTQERGWCYELFRRALEERDADAWEAIERQYIRLVVSWVGPTLPDVAVLTRETLENFWLALHARKLSPRFEHVGGLLGYLKKCAWTTREKLFRNVSGRYKIVSMEEDVADPADRAAATLAELNRQLFWQRIERTLQPPPLTFVERLVLEYSFKQDLSPAEVSSMFPLILPTSGDVNKVRERLLKRLQRRMRRS